MYYACLFRMLYTCTSIALGGVLTSRVTFVLAMMSLHMLTFRLIVAEFCSLVILNNILLGSVVHEPKGLMKELYLYSPVCIDTFPHAMVQVH